MGIFNFFRKKEEIVDQTAIDDLIAFSKQAIAQAIPEIERTNSFLPFGGILSIDGVLEKVVYMDPSKQTVDHREHATMVQKVIEKKYNDPKTKLLFMAFDGIAHLSTGEIDSINVRVTNKQKGIHRLLTYPYKIVDNKVELINKNNPIIKSL